MTSCRCARDDGSGRGSRKSTWRLVDACIAERSCEYTAMAVALLFGLRASEVARRQVRDLDAVAGSRGWRKDKTAARGGAWR